jgi:hypothetical protein
VNRKPWFVAGSDDRILRVYDIHSQAIVSEWLAHDDYIRSIEVHPVLPYIIRFVHFPNKNPSIATANTQLIFLVALAAPTTHLLRSGTGRLISSVS